MQPRTIFLRICQLVLLLTALFMCARYTFDDSLDYVRANLVLIKGMLFMAIFGIALILEKLEKR
jgi:hypothetical protein